MSPEEIGDQRVPLIEEVLRVEKHAVTAERVVLHKQVRTRDATVEIALRSEELDVERVPVGRVVTEAPSVREQDGVTIVPLVEEELVVSKRLVLREEIHIRRRSSSTMRTATETLRSEEIVIERDPAPGIKQETESDEHQHEQ